MFFCGFFCRGRSCACPFFFGVFLWIGTRSTPTEIFCRFWKIFVSFSSYQIWILCPPLPAPKSDDSEGESSVKFSLMAWAFLSLEPGFSPQMR